MSLLNLLIDLLMDDMLEQPFDSYTFKSVLVSAHCPSNCMTQLTIRKFFVPLTALHFFSYRNLFCGIFTTQKILSNMPVWELFPQHCVYFQLIKFNYVLKTFILLQ